MTNIAKFEKSSTLAEHLLNQLQTSIIKGELAAGSKINEQSLALKYGMSRGPAREALQILEQRRLVVRIPHTGARVATLTVSELNDLYELRSTLEGMACELAAKRITEQQLDQLWQLITRQEAALKSGDTYFQEEGDVDFHYHIINASGNKHLQETLTTNLYHLIRMYRYQCNKTHRPQAAIVEHRRIVEALALRNGELARSLMRHHIEQGRQQAEITLKKSQS